MHLIYILYQCNNDTFLFSSTLSLKAANTQRMIYDVYAHAYSGLFHTPNERKDIMGEGTWCRQLVDSFSLYTPGGFQNIAVNMIYCMPVQWN